MAAFASAYSLGRWEAAAALNLLKNIPPHITQVLTDLVRWEHRSFVCSFADRLHTMPKFITHEALAGSTFNEGATTGSGTTLAWQEQLVNTPEILSLLVRRMRLDYEGVQPKNRKPWGAKDVVA